MDKLIGNCFRASLQEFFQFVIDEVQNSISAVNFPLNVVLVGGFGKIWTSK